MHAAKRSVGIDEANTHALGINKLALRTKLRNLNVKSHFSIFDSFRDILWLLRWAWQTFLGQSVGIDKNNKFHLKFLKFWLVKSQ